MTLTQQQKALVENVIMVVEEVTSEHGYYSRKPDFNWIIFYAFERVKTVLRQEKPGIARLMPLEHILAVARVIGKEVRRARSYKDMTAEEIIEALDTAYKILEMIE